MATTFEPATLRPVVLASRWPGMLAEMLRGDRTWDMAHFQALADAQGAPMAAVSAHHADYVKRLARGRLKLDIDGPHAKITPLGRFNRLFANLPETVPDFAKPGALVVATHRVLLDEHTPVWRCLVWRVRMGDVVKSPAVEFFAGDPGFRSVPPVWKIDGDLRAYLDLTLSEDPWFRDAGKLSGRVKFLSRAFELRALADCGLLLDEGDAIEGAYDGAGNCGPMSGHERVRDVGPSRYDPDLIRFWG